MSWWNLFGSSNKEKYSPVLNAFEQQRLKQIETLRTFFPSATEVRKDTEYKITLIIQNNILDIYVFLPPNFPNEVPVVRVLPEIRHPWVNDQMIVIGCDSLNNFYMHSNLGKALQDVCKQFTQITPIFCQSDNNLSVSTSSETLVQLEPERVHSDSFQPLVRPTNFVDLPEITRKLDNCSVEELNELNNHPEKILEFMLNANLAPSNAVKEREDQMSNNEKIARGNLEERLPRLEAARRRLLDKYEELSVVRANFDDWSLKQNDLCEMHTPVKIKTALQIAAAQADEEAESIAEAFLNEKIGTEEFIAKLIEHRKFSHIRHWKEDNVLKL